MNGTGVLQVVLLIFSTTICAGFFFKLLEPKDFVMLAGMVLSYWFGTTVPGKTSEPNKAEVK